MNQFLKSIATSKEEEEFLREILSDVGENNSLRIVNLLKEYGCHSNFIKEVIISKRKILMMDFDRLKYILDAILANGDIIEEILLDLV